ncbi:hypothetical protein N7456_013484 [Penicillium angulare]|uniref:Uncharacterized protein n=1 Tax=Penicillium angulare TaxID=116970 RepID=A0A9W9EGA0_9EURO|nr:hypothetical protein N7456_013484 [Penicillium angulare]
MPYPPKQNVNLEAGTTTIGDNNSIARCNLKNCEVTGSWLKGCTFEDCLLSKVRVARRTTATKSHFHDVYAVKSSDISQSTIRDGSSAKRCTMVASTIKDASKVNRSTLTSCTVSKGDLWRSTLKDCNIEECVIYRSNFEGLILKYGVWKRGKLVSRVADREPIAIRKDGSVITFPVQPTSSHLPRANLNTQPPIHGDKTRAFSDDSDGTIDSDDSDIEKDLPPPYEV